jgi:hypothetical protein
MSRCENKNTSTPGKTGIGQTIVDLSDGVCRSQLSGTSLRITQNYNVIGAGINNNANADTISTNIVNTYATGATDIAEFQVTIDFNTQQCFQSSQCVQVSDTFNGDYRLTLISYNLDTLTKSFSVQLSLTFIKDIRPNPLGDYQTSIKSGDVILIDSYYEPRLLEFTTTASFNPIVRFSTQNSLECKVAKNSYNNTRISNENFYDLSIKEKHKPCNDKHRKHHKSRR